MFGWNRDRRRRQTLAAPVTAVELAELPQQLWQATRLSMEQQTALIRWMRVFTAEKHWEGCLGLTVTHEMKQAVAAAAGLMVLGHRDWYFDRTPSIVIYPNAYLAKLPASSQAAGVVGEFPRAGETVYGGPVVVNWKDIQRARLFPDAGHHLVIHEFAHQLDMINGPQADGLPPLLDPITEQQWLAAFTDEYQLSQRLVEAGERILLDDYGLVSLGEFFAVASERYFQTPEALARYHPGVFRLLAQFYRIDLRQFT
jgi:Mlc titration factor MtfA (ptsG expression regulator)